MITGIGHTAYRVSDVEESLAFYCGKLGLKEMFRLHRDSGELWLIYLHVTDSTFIELFPNGNDEVALTTTSRGYTHLCLNVDDMEKTLAELAARGLPIEGEPKRGRDGNIQFWITDPDGNRIELMQMMPDSMQAKAIAALKGQAQ
jgi:lactoylglutathione lyase